MSNSQTGSPDLLASCKVIADVSCPPTLPFPNNSPSTSPIKKKLKTEADDIDVDIKKALEIEWLNTFLAKAINDKEFNFANFSLEELMGLWKEKTGISDEDFSDTIETELRSNLQKILPSSQISKPLPIVPLDSFYIDVVVRGQYYFIDNFHCKFQMSKIYSLQSDADTKLIGVISADTNRLFDHQTSLSLQKNKTLIIKEIFVDTESEFASILCASLTKLDTIFTFQFFQQNKGLLGDDDLLAEYKKKEEPVATILTLSESFNVKLPNLNNCVLKLHKIE